MTEDSRVMGPWTGWVAVGCAMLMGCAEQQRFGSFVVASEPALRAVAADVVLLVERAWPAERRAVQLLEPDDDPFAKAFAAELRRAGYRVFAAEGTPGRAIGLHFAVDTLGDSGLLRVTLFERGGQWSRAYRSVGGNVKPAGPWSGSGFAGESSP